MDTYGPFKESVLVRFLLVDLYGSTAPSVEASSCKLDVRPRASTSCLIVEVGSKLTLNT